MKIDIKRESQSYKALFFVTTISIIVSGALIFNGSYLTHKAQDIFTGLSRDNTLLRTSLNSLNNTIERKNQQLNESNQLIEQSKNIIDTLSETIQNQQILIDNYYYLVQQTEVEKTWINDKLQRQIEINENLTNEIIELYSELRYFNDNLTSIVKHPSYDEMVAFLQLNTIDQNEYITPNYVCYHFAMDTINDAFYSGYYSAYVQIQFADGTSHAIIAFQTIDRGLVYVEPQSDSIVTVQEGIRYWVDNGYPSDHDDTIIEVRLVW